MTEYLYDKENPKSRLRYKPQGWESFYRGMPNHYERAEMIGRRLLKDYDGDLAKISLTTKKPYDPAQRWRTLKNMTRFFKNPLGFIGWRYLYKHNLNSGINAWYLGCGVCIFMVIYQMALKQRFMNDHINAYQYKRGQRGFFPLKGWTDTRTVVGPETVMNKKKMSNFNAMYKNMHENNVTSAYWCRDQNFRKYFEMRKKNDIEPSVDYNNFYNKDKCKAYYDGLVEMTFMRDQVRHVTDK